MADRPADNPPAERVEHDSAEHLALACRMLGDVRHPQLVGPLTHEHPVDEIVGRRDARDAPALAGTLRPTMLARCINMATAL